MSSKKKQRNGFFYFMLDMKEELRRQGRNVPMAQMSALAGPKWSNLPEAEKAAYNLKAKHEKRNASILESSLPKHSPGRLDSAGELISERRDYFLENEERRRRKNEEMKREITIDKNIPLYKFYFLDIQGFCELKELKRDRWLPCEIAIAEFSLIHGIHTTFHQFVDPGPIPMGYRYEAQSQSERTHMVPVEGFELATKNYRQLLTDLKSFTNQSVAGASPVCPLIFAKKDNVERVEYLLNWLTIKAGIEPVIEQVFELEALMVHLDALSNQTTLSSDLSIFQASDFLRTSAYDYERGTRCGYHEPLEIKFCSMNTVKIYCYVLSDYLCPKYSISITPNHLPEQTIMPVISTNHSLPKTQVMMRGVASPQERIDVPTKGGIGRGRGRGLAGKLPVVRQPHNPSNIMK